jgi:hypothetical protein
MATKNPFARGTPVSYRTRTKTGVATVQKVRETPRGKWVDLKTSEGDKLTLRPGCLTAA